MADAIADELMEESSSDTPRPLTDHLEELRWRLVWCVAALAVLSVPGYFLVDWFLRQIAAATGPLVFLKPTEAFAVRMETALALGLFFSVPVLIYQLWRFIGIALTIEERTIVLGALPFSYLLFAAGACLAWFVVVPLGLKFLIGFGSEYMRPALSAQACLSFALWVTIGMGALFQIPVVTAALAHWGVLRADTLRFYRRHALVGILVVAALLTPGPDLASQLLLAAPAYLLYEISVLIAAFLETKRPPTD